MGKALSVNKKRFLYYQSSSRYDKLNFYSFFFLSSRNYQLDTDESNQTLSLMVLECGVLVSSMCCIFRSVQVYSK